MFKELGRLFRNGFRYGMSWQNTLYQRHVSGGKIVFGSLGFLQKDGFTWLYGDENWTTIEDFVSPFTLSVTSM